MRSEIPSGMCAKLRTVAASNNRDHASQSHFAYASHHVQSFTRYYGQSFHVAISLIIACSLHAYIFLFFTHISFVVNNTINTTPPERLQLYMSWWRWMVSDSNKFVLVRNEGIGSVGKHLVLRTASTYQLLVKAPSWLHWDWLWKWWGCTATMRCSVIVGMQSTSINETAGFTYCRIPGVCNLYYWRAKCN